MVPLRINGPSSLLADLADKPLLPICALFPTHGRGLWVSTEHGARVCDLLQRRGRIRLDHVLRRQRDAAGQAQARARARARAQGEG